MPKTQLDFEQRVAELTEILDISRAVHQSLEPDTVAQTIVDRVFRLPSVEAVALYHAQPKFALLAHMPETDSIAVRRLLLNYSASLDDVWESGAQKQLVVVDPDQVSRLVWLIPLRVVEETVAILAIWEHDPDTLSARERFVLENVNEQAALALHNALAHAETNATLSERVIELSTIEVVSRHIAAALERDTIVGDVLAAIVSAIDAEVGSCFLCNVAGHFELIHRYDTPDTQLSGDEAIQAALPFIEQIARRRAAAIFSAADGGVFNETLAGLTPGIHSLLGVPILRDDTTIGVLLFEDSATNAFTEAHLQFVVTLAEHTAVALENARLYEEVRAGRDQLQAILDSTRDAVLLFDHRGRLLRYNPAAETMLGHDLRMYLGESFTSWLRTTRARRLQEVVGLSLVQFRQHILEVLRNPTRVTQRQFQQVRGENVHYIDETGSPVIDEMGQPVGWLVVWRDNTEERRLDTMRRELNSMVVHDLRNPITSIISGMAMLQDLLVEGQTDQGLIAEVIRIAQNSAENMLNLVQSLLDVSRLEQSSVALDCESLSLLDPIDEAMKSVLGLALSAGISIITQIPDDLPPVWIDDEKIQRVLVNLLDNALRHTPYDGMIYIEATHRPEERAVWVRIDDTGPGIPPEARSRIFDKFVQLDQAALRGHKGTGLGLTFCKLAIEAHGGRIWVEEGDNGGAAFCFTVPVAFANGLWTET